MIQDAMKAVEAAENAASEKIQAARSDADKIRRDSELQYQKIKDDAVISSRKSEENRLKEVDEEGKAEAEKAQKAADAKAMELKDSSVSRKDEAVKAVIAEILK